MLKLDDSASSSRQAGAEAAQELPFVQLCVWDAFTFWRCRFTVQALESERRIGYQAGSLETARA